MNEPEFKKFYGNEMANNYMNELSASLFEIIVEDANALIEKNNDQTYYKMKEFLDSEN